MKRPDLNKVNRALDKYTRKLSCKQREGYYSHTIGEPRLEHIYKDRSYKSALAMDLKIQGADDSKHWCWRK